MTGDSPNCGELVREDTKAGAAAEMPFFSTLGEPPTVSRMPAVIGTGDVVVGVVKDAALDGGRMTGSIGFLLLLLLLLLSPEDTTESSCGDKSNPWVPLAVIGLGLGALLLLTLSDRVDGKAAAMDCCSTGFRMALKSSLLVGCCCCVCGFGVCWSCFCCCCCSC